MSTNALLSSREPKPEPSPSMEERLTMIEDRLDFIEAALATMPAVSQGILGKIQKWFRA